MPSFDVVCEIDMHEVTNAVDQANREVSARFDFKGSHVEFKLEKNEAIQLEAESDFQLSQMIEILKNKLAKRMVDLKHLDVQEPSIQHKKAEQTIKLQQGISTEKAKEIVKLIKEKKLKVQASIQGEKVRVTGKKRDDLQEVIGMLKKEEQLNLPLQFNNFRD